MIFDAKMCKGLAQITIALEKDPLRLFKKKSPVFFHIYILLEPKFGRAKEGFF